MIDPDALARDLVLAHVEHVTDGDGELLDDAALCALVWRCSEAAYHHAAGVARDQRAMVAAGDAQAAFLLECLYGDDDPWMLADPWRLLDDALRGGH